MEEKKYCIVCRHEICPTCKQGCHNFGCLQFSQPVKSCYDQLLPKKGSPQNTLTTDGKGSLQWQEGWAEKLWNKHCIHGTAENPTDTMYYEGFIDAVREMISQELSNIISNNK